MCCKIGKAAFLTLTARHSPLKERFQKTAADRARVILIAVMEAAAATTYSALYALVVAKVEAGELAEDEADAYGNKITAAFAAVCQDAEDGFPEVFKAKLAASDTATEGNAEIAAMEAAALALYDAINPMVMAKFEAGELETEDEANAYGNKITAAFAAACQDADEDDFPELFKAKLAGSD